MREQDRVIAGRYRVIARLGSGGMGVVWLAYDERLHRKVAVKQLLLPAGLAEGQAERANRRALREGRIAAKLQHPHLISVYDVVEVDGQAYLVMEYVPSTSLTEVLAERGPLSAAETARWGAQAAAGLAAAHTGGVVHRDVKPGNVLLGEDGTVKITDFGVSRTVEDATATTTGMIAGTPAYLSPEVARGQQATFASDVFSLGATLYAAVEGRPPFGTDDNTMALLYRVASGQVSPPARAGSLTGPLMRMLTVDPPRRPSMTEVSEELAALAAPPAGTDTVKVDPVEADRAPAASPGPANRRRGVAAVAAAAVLLVLAGVVLSTLLDRDEPGQAAAPPQTRPTLITGYYALMPRDLRQAWTWLTPKYQRSPAGGYGGYQTFWSRITGVRVSGVTAAADNTVEATVEYRFTDGCVVRERHRYVLIEADGRWKIDESTVLNSVTL